MAGLLLGAGELLWDLLPSGRRLGGAPANFAFHASRLGCRGAVASRVGTDPLGREALRTLDLLGVDRSRVQVDPELPTGTVEVALDGEGRPDYTIREGVAWDALAFTPGLEALARDADAVCFGTLAARDPRARETLFRVLDAARGLRILDVNLRPPFVDGEVLRALLARADALKASGEELPVVAALCGAEADPASLRTALGLSAVAVTLGPKGGVLCTEDGRFEEPGLRVQVVDTVGAGDAFAAALATGLVQGLDPAGILQRATRLSAFVCTKEGAMPETGEFLRRDPHFRTRVQPGVQAHSIDRHRPQ